MRYYSIEIRDPTSGQLIRPAYFEAIALPASYASFVNNTNLPNALNIELDIPVSTYANPRQGAWLRVWGISIPEISQSVDLNGMDILLYGGMQKGLPLAKPAQSGLLMQGTIFQAFGNWVGVDQTLDFTLLPSTGRLDQPINLTIKWEGGQPMSGAIRTALQAAFKSAKFTIDVRISDQLKLPGNTQPGFYPTLNTFATAIFRLSQSPQFAGIKPKGGGAYAGVQVVVRGNTILVFDGTVDYGKATFENPIQIDFEDLIGQPTWIGPNSMNFKTVMRADIQVGDYIRMPTNIVSPFAILTPGAAFPNVPARNKSIFQGVFSVLEVHHFGNFRQPDARSWVTAFDATAILTPNTGGGTAP